ncbi:MAG: ABC transporter ATP-binding protein [Acidimicrobiaceae bacterium]|nr:ABC transporter ATP-binding protein [Acidimicrobiaceae bacterium]MCY4176266.1 ABC transporter ATP-binding protein [Acidimicrobiaceae bacterium]MCY4280244.1 ABC transporter ATP-binding protein [Acidimicrobiaceae bacterium]MCY4293574.1 ABC transporter ATP-binding protein [Acidimicrobiaceae bacterium]
MAAPTPAVEIDGVTKRFGDVVAVDDITLTIDDGEFFALLGPSGCGKTTTLRMIAGLDLPSSGSLRIFGDEVGMAPPDRRPVNTVFQAYALFPHMTVRQNIEFGLRMRRVNKSEMSQRTEQAIAMVRLAGMEERRPSQLSGGQQQRVALARALVNQPKVLLLDEPLGALDLKLRQEMQQELKALQQQVGITFIFVTHDQEEALAMSERIGVMSQGHLLQVGSPREIYEHPTSRFVADFIGRTNLIEAEVESAGTLRLQNGKLIAAGISAPSGAAVAVSLRPEHIRVHPRDASASRGDPGDPGGDSLDGTIADVTYLGHAVVYSVAAGPTTIEARREGDLGEPLAVGASVTVSWDHGAVAVIED